MTDLQTRLDVVKAYKDHSYIMKRSRNGGEITHCFEPPVLWNWREFEYYVHDELSPVQLLRAEVEQACRDGEAVILTQEAGKALVEYLEKR